MNNSVSNLTVVIPRLANKKPIICHLNKKLGEGSFGSVYLVQNNEKTPMACKIVNLTDENSKPILQMLRLTYREIYFLRRENILIGYWRDQKQQKMYILMKWIKGLPEIEVPNDIRSIAEYASFKALRKLHRAGIAHMDPHENNFHFDLQTQQATLLDFGLAQDYHFFRELYDFHQFLSWRHSNPPIMSQQYLKEAIHLFQFYCQEIKEYILQNNCKNAQILFCYAGLFISAFAGISMLGAISVISQELIKMTLFQKLSECLEVIQEHHESQNWETSQNSTAQMYYHLKLGILIILQGLLSAMQISNLYTHTSEHYFSITVSVVDLMLTMIQLKPLAHTLNYWHNNLEKYLFSESQLDDYYRQKIESSSQNAYIPGFLSLSDKPSQSNASQSKVDLSFCFASRLSSI